MKNKNLLVFAAVIFLIILVLKLFLVFNTPLGFNEATYYSIANFIPEGKLPYLDTFDHKPPMVYYLLSLFLSIFGFSITLMHILTLLLDLSLAIAIFLFIKRYFNLTLAFLASLISFSLVTNVYYDTEIPMVILGLLGLIFYLKSFESKTVLFLLISGVCLALSVWFKQPGIIFFLAVIIHQIFLIKNQEKRFKESLKEIYFVIAGAIIVSLPILSYLVYKIGLDTLFFHIITFNLKFSGATSRILQVGKLAEMLLFNFGVFLAIIAFFFKDLLKEVYPRKNLLFAISLVISIIFFLVNKEVFYMHLYALIPTIAFLTIASISLIRENKAKSLIIFVILIFILGFFMFNLENTARNYRSSSLSQKNQIIQNISAQIQNSGLFADSPIYYTLLGKKCDYRFCYFAPSVASVFKFEDFCNFSLTRDYLVLTNRKNYLGQENLACISKNFILVSRFENVDDSYLELWRKNGAR